MTSYSSSLAGWCANTCLPPSTIIRLVPIIGRMASVEEKDNYRVSGASIHELHKRMFGLYIQEHMKTTQMCKRRALTQSEQSSFRFRKYLPLCTNHFVGFDFPHEEKDVMEIVKKPSTLHGTNQLVPLRTNQQQSDSHQPRQQGSSGRTDERETMEDIMRELQKNQDIARQSMEYDRMRAAFRKEAADLKGDSKESRAATLELEQKKSRENNPQLNRALASMTRDERISATFPSPSPKVVLQCGPVQSPSDAKSVDQLDRQLVEESKVYTTYLKRTPSVLPESANQDVWRSSCTLKMVMPVSLKSVAPCVHSGSDENKMTALSKVLDSIVQRQSDIFTYQSLEESMIGVIMSRIAEIKEALRERDMLDIKKTPGCCMHLQNLETLRDFHIRTNSDALEELLVLKREREDLELKISGLMEKVLGTNEGSFFLDAEDYDLTDL